MQEEKVKKQIQVLIDDFRANKSKYENGSEADTETKLIEPLFEALGWGKNDFDKRPSAGREGKRGIADYAFKIDDKIVFYLEAKKVGIFLEKEADKQVISYALSKRPTIPFAVSTNFKEMNIFCVEQENALHQTFRSFKNPEDYLTDFSSLMWLSKENFENGATLKKAEDEERLKKRVAIDKILLDDLMRIRKLLVEDIEKNYSNKYELNEKEEIVQRIIDRLIFIRRCEDVGINPENKVLREITNLPHSEAYPKLKEYFKSYDEIYNSGLFAIGIDNDCDKIKVDGEIIKVLIERLYESKDSQYYYNFSWIDADVLGQVYEQYLGKILQQTKSGKAKLKEGQAHKKEQGIYYTPTYVVDFIVKNTLKELLKDKKNKPKEVTILDSACGSGSFLIKAFDYLYENLSVTDDAKQHKFDSQGLYSIKTEILKKNIYGVDLDNKAVEITKLNLLLKAAEKNRKLPEEVDLHIKQGDSLVDDAQISGLNAFIWQDKFKEIFALGGFDVIIGNPPYVDIKQLEPKLVKYLFSAYATVENRMNLYSTFIEKGFKLLKSNGYFGFIIPNSILYNASYSKIRNLLLTNTTLKCIVRLPDNVFEGVKVETIIIIYKKAVPRPNAKCEVLVYPRNATISSIKRESCPEVLSFNQSTWKDKGIINIFTNKSSEEILSKIELENKPLITWCDFSLGLTPYDKYKGHTKKQIEERVFHSTTPKDKTFKPLLSGENITRYNVCWDKKGFISYGKWLGAPREQRFFTQPRIIVRQIISGKPPRIYAGYTDEELYNTQIAFSLIARDENKVKLKYILAIINSTLTNYFHREKYLDKSKNLFQKILIANAKNFPIKSIPLAQQNELITLVDKLILLNKQLRQYEDKLTSTRQKIEEELKNIESEIDEMVYKIYGITLDEKKLIEDSVKE